MAPMIAPTKTLTDQAGEPEEIVVHRGAIRDAPDAGGDDARRWAMVPVIGRPDPEPDARLCG